MKHFLSYLTASVILIVPVAPAGVFIESYPGPIVTPPIPDGGAGIANVLSISGSSILLITNVAVDLEISGSWNGDIYATLAHDSGFSVLLNRVGKSSGGAFPIGFSSDGFDVTLDDDPLVLGTPDIHTHFGGSGMQIGTFESDGRAVDPALVDDPDPRTARLDVFNGLDANGDWTLYVEDLLTGEPHTLVSWGLTISGVPEASESALAMLAASGLLVARRRKRREL